MKTMNLRKTNLYENTKSIRTSICTSAYLHICTFLLICTFAHLHINTFAQNVGISATGINPDNSAMLDVTSNTKGMLIPRMTGDEKYAIPSPATGLLIYQTPDTAGFWYYDGTKWIPLVSSTSSTASPSNAGWLTTGNIGTAWNKNFFGTTDNVSLRIRTSNTERMIVDSLGRVGIGTASPVYKLDILDSNSAGSGVLSSTLNINQIRTEPNITTATSALGIRNILLYRMTEATPGTQGTGYAAVNIAYTDGASTFYQLRGAANTAYTTSTATTNQGGLFGTVNTGYLNSSGTLGSAYGAYNQVYNNSSGTITNAIAASNYVFLNTGATGTITAAYGSSNYMENLSTAGGSITTAVGVRSYINKAAAASAIGTGYLYYGNYGSGAATKHYGIYITGEDTNYFSGKVGIGTATPTAKLTVSKDTNQFSITTGDSRKVLDIKYNTVGNFVSYGVEDGYAAAALTFRNNGAERMRITKDGYVGIGTTSPKAGLQVGTTGTLISPVPGGQGTTLGFNVYNDAGTYKAITTGNRSAYWDLNNSRLYLKYTSGVQTADVALSTVMNIMAVDNGTGNVGINCDNPQYKLHVIGDIASSATIRGVNAYVTGAITACSDIRYKKDITPLSHALDKVLSMQGVNYHWKTKEFPEKQFTADNQIGFIAQELEKIVPEVVMTDKDGYKSVDYSRLTPVLVEAIKELKKENDSLKSEVGSMKSEIERIKNALSVQGVAKQ